MFYYFDYLYFFFVLLTLFMGVLVILSNPKSRNNIIFFLVTIGAIGWMLTLYMGYYFVDFAKWDIALVWMRLAYGFSVLGISFMTVFIYIFPNPIVAIKPIYKYLYGLGTLTVFLIASFTPYVNEGFFIGSGVYIKDTLGGLYFLYIIDIIFNLIASIVFLLLKIKKIHGIERGKMVLVTFGYFVFVALAVPTNVILPVFDIIILQKQVPIFILAFVLPSYYAIHKYRFFNLSYISLNLIRKFIVYGISFFGVYVILRGLTIIFSYEHISVIALISVLAGIMLISTLGNMVPELISGSFRNFRNILATLKSQVYFCDTYKKLQKLIEESFLINLNFSKSTLYVIRDNRAKIDIPIYVNDKFTDVIKRGYRDILVKDEIRYKNMDKTLKKTLIAGLDKLHASLCIPLFSENNLVGLFALNRNEIFSREEIDEFVKLKKDIEIGLMNVLLKMNLQEENDLMKAVINRKTKNLKDNIIRIKELLRQQSDFIAVTAHEFRTPLNIASFQLEDLMEANKSKKGLSEDLKIIDGSLNNLKSLIQKMFNVQQYDLKKVEVNMERVEIKKYVKDIYKEFVPVMKEKNIKFSLYEDLKSDVKIRMDKAQIRQVFHNVLNNAYKYTPQDGKVSLSVQKNKKQLIVQVCDNGKGIPKKSRKRVFEKFQTVNVGTGIGLGLYLCKKIIELHKGEIWAQESEWGGSCFCFTLPN